MEKPQFLIELTNEILKVLDEEIESRPYIFQNGVRDISDKVGGDDGDDDDDDDDDDTPTHSFNAIDKC